MKYSAFLFLFLLFFACGKTQRTTEQSLVENAAQNTETQPAEKTTEPADMNEVEPEIEQEEVTRAEPSVPPVFEKKLSDEKVTFDIYCENGEQSKYIIKGSGFNRDVKFEETVEGQLIDAHLLDLNKDGFSEIYLVFNQTGDSGNKMLKGYSSYSNRSAGEIYIKDTDMIRRVNSDKVFVDGNKLVRTFQDENGNSIQFNYKLAKGESSFVLTPEKK